MQFAAAYQILAILAPVIIGLALGGYLTDRLLELRDELSDWLVRLFGSTIGGLLGGIFDLVVVIPFLLAS